MAKVKRSKTPDLRPARARYWMSGRLGKRKVKNLFASGKFPTLAAAESFWRGVRKRYVG